MGCNGTANDQYCGLCEEVLTVEPPIMINLKQGTARPTITNQLKLELSNLDQLYDSYPTLALFYKAPSSTSQQLENSTKSSPSTPNIFNVASILRSALEELLLHYPFAAGRLCFNEQERRFEVRLPDVEEDRGIQFISARASIRFSELGEISAPHPSLDLLYPNVQLSSNGPPLVAIQVTSFACGGFILSIKCSHAYMDGHSSCVFLQNLCSIARGDGLAIIPDQVSRRERIKPLVPPTSSSHPFNNYATKYIVRMQRQGGSRALMWPVGRATRFVFTHSTLETMRQGAKALIMESTSCSRFVALAALLWSSRIKSLVACGQLSLLSDQCSIHLAIPVNARESIVPELSKGYVGNALCVVVTSATVQEFCALSTIVHKIKSALATGATHEHIQSFTDLVELQYSQNEGGTCLRLNPCISLMPSLVSLPFYHDTDCGWGCPAYCGFPSLLSSNVIIILDDPNAQSWNVLLPFQSEEEHAFFKQELDLNMKHYSNACKLTPQDKATTKFVALGGDSHEACKLTPPNLRPQ